MSITGSKNTVIGYGASLPNPNASNQIVLGTQNETVYLGGAGNTGGGGIIINSSALTLSGNTTLTVSGKPGIAGQYFVSNGNNTPYWGPPNPQTLLSANTPLSIVAPLSNMYIISGSTNWELTMPTVTTGNIWFKNMATTSGTINASSIVRLGSNQVVTSLPIATNESSYLTYTGNSWYELSNSTKNAPYTFSVTPSVGSSTSSTNVTLAGANYTGATSVLFGAVSVTFNVVNDNTITATVPAGSGSVSVTVTTPSGGTSTQNGLFQFAGQTTLTSIVPNFGPVQTFTPVTITGTNFYTGATVLFGSVAGTNVTIINSTTLTVLPPSQAVGQVNVTVNTSTGLPYNYVVSAAPTWTSINPPTGEPSSTVVITGTQFWPSSTLVSFGTIYATIQSVSLDGTTINATVPTGSPGASTVTVYTPYGSCTGTYTYLPLPVLTAISPEGGVGGMTFTILGQNFYSPLTVTFNGTNAVVTVVNTSIITGTVPAGTGAATVLVQIFGVTSNGITYTYGNTSKYVYTGLNQTFTAPSSTLSVTVAGSTGGPGHFNDFTSIGGFGCKIVATSVPVTSSSTYYIICGGTDGAYAGSGRNAQSPYYYGGDGGGYSGILKFSSSPNSNGQPTSGSPTSTLIIAGAGGGGCIEVGADYAGIGGNTNGGNGSTPYDPDGVGTLPATGGTQSAGGSAAVDLNGYTASSGSEFQGGNAYYGTGSGGGGGGGYYGGGGGSTSSGAGGSSYVNPGITYTPTEGDNSGTGYVIISW